MATLYSSSARWSSHNRLASRPVGEQRRQRAKNKGKGPGCETRRTGVEHACADAC
jgi:hypothetical protein